MVHETTSFSLSPLIAAADKMRRDNEKPRRQIEVPAFQAQARPITNEEVRIDRSKRR